MGSELLSLQQSSFPQPQPQPPQHSTLCSRLGPAATPLPNPITQPASDDSIAVTRSGLSLHQRLGSGASATAATVASSRKASLHAAIGNALRDASLASPPLRPLRGRELAAAAAAAAASKPGLGGPWGTVLPLSAAVRMGNGRMFAVAMVAVAVVATARAGLSVAVAESASLVKVLWLCLSVCLAICLFASLSPALAVF